VLYRHFLRLPGPTLAESGSYGLGSVGPVVHRTYWDLSGLWAKRPRPFSLFPNKTKIPLHFGGTSSSPFSSHAFKIFAENRFNCLKQTPKT